MKQETSIETPKRIAERFKKPHRFIPGVWLWGQRLCKECYAPFYYAAHAPSFGQGATIRKGK